VCDSDPESFLFYGDGIAAAQSHDADASLPKGSGDGCYGVVKHEVLYPRKAIS